MESLSRTSEKLFAYVLDNRLIFAVGAYFFLSVILKISIGMDCCIPCLWKTVFGVECPGCGLTTSFISILKFDFSGAYQNNPLVFMIIPLLAFALMLDYRKFNLKYDKK